jgi:hypothetical protein
MDREFIRKLAFVDAHTRVESVRVGASPGFWISGGPHEIGYLKPDGEPFPESTRLAGNTLVWQRGAVTLRLECSCTKDRALGIAESMR